MSSTLVGILLVLGGVVVLIGAIRKWEWVIKPPHKRTLLSSILGGRGMAFVFAGILIILGVVAFLFYNV